MVAFEEQSWPRWEERKAKIAVILSESKIVPADIEPIILGYCFEHIDLFEHLKRIRIGIYLSPGPKVLSGNRLFGMRILKNKSLPLLSHAIPAVEEIFNSIANPREDPPQWADLCNHGTWLCNSIICEHNRAYAKPTKKEMHIRRMTKPWSIPDEEVPKVKWFDLMQKINAKRYIRSIATYCR